MKPQDLVRPEILALKGDSRLAPDLELQRALADLTAEPDARR